MKKNILRLMLTFIIIAFARVIHYAWISFPIINGFSAKLFYEPLKVHIRGMLCCCTAPLV
jgi:hypothetical protein